MAMLSLRRKPKTWEMFQVVYSALVSHGRKFRLPLAVVFCPFLYSGNKNNLMLHQHSAKNVVAAAKRWELCFTFVHAQLAPCVVATTAFRFGDSRQRGERRAYAVVAVGGFSLASYVRIAPKFGWWWRSWVRQILGMVTWQMCWWRWCTCCCCFHRNTYSKISSQTFWSVQPKPLRVWKQTIYHWKAL